MTKEATQVLEDALSLSVSDRANVVYRLLSTLQFSDLDDDVQAVWRDELEKRAHAAMSDDWSGEPWSAVRERVTPT